MGQGTEHLSTKTGPGFGALINATFGNATELIISILALRQGYIEIVRASISGAIIGNVLFVTGAALVVTGIKKKEVVFNPQAVGMVTALLCLASIAMVMPLLVFLSFLWSPMNLGFDPLGDVTRMFAFR